jgi:hypothetical protein
LVFFIFSNLAPLVRWLIRALPRDGNPIDINEGAACIRRIAAVATPIFLRMVTREAAIGTLRQARQLSPQHVLRALYGCLPAEVVNADCGDIGRLYEFTTSSCGTCSTVRDVRL